MRCEFRGQPVGFAELARNCRRRGESVANGSEIARAAAIEAESRQRAQEVRRAGQRPAQGVPQRVGLDQEVERVEPLVNRFRIGERAREPLGEEPRPRRGDGQVDRRQKRTVPRAGQRPGQLEIGARRGIDLEGRAAGAACRRRERRPCIELGAPDVGQRERRRRDLGAREGPESVKRLDAIEFADPALGSRSVAGLARERGYGNPHIGDDAAEGRLVRNRLGGDDFAGFQPRDLGGEAGVVGFAQGKRAGRKIERRQTKGCARLAPAEALNRNEEPRATGLEEPLLGDRARRHQPHDAAAHD